MIGNEPKYSIMLTDLDCIFDTRLGTLVNIDNELADRIFEEDLYFDRLEDSFKELSKEDFYSYYKRRNKLILSNSPLTKILAFIQEFILGTLKNSINSPFKYEPKLIVNTFPYRLNEDEEKRILANLVYLTNESCEVELINNNPLDIEPSFIKSQIAVWVAYEYAEWLEKYAENKQLEKNLMPDVSLIVPAIFFHHIPTAKEKVNLAKHNLDPFQALEITSKPIINLKVIKLSTFCIDPKYYTPEETKEENTEDKNDTSSPTEDEV